jgi:hypothetical protein
MILVVQEYGQDCPNKILAKIYNCFENDIFNMFNDKYTLMTEK